MAVTFNGTIQNGIRWSISQPSCPLIGDCYTDLMTGKSMVWTGTSWAEITDGRMIPSDALMTPTEEQLEKHPSLKEAWDEYIVIRKLLGI